MERERDMDGLSMLISAHVKNTCSASLYVDEKNYYH